MDWNELPSFCSPGLHQHLLAHVEKRDQHHKKVCVPCRDNDASGGASDTVQNGYYAPAPVGEAGTLGGHRHPSSVRPSVCPSVCLMRNDGDQA